MKKITLSIMLALGAFTFGTANAQCSANGTMTPTGTPGEFTITDLSTAGNQPYSVFITHDNTSPSNQYVPLQPNSTTGTFQYPANGQYSWGIQIVDSITGCVDYYWDSVTVTGMSTVPNPGNCMASFNLQQDSNNMNQYWCWNNSVGSSPSLTLTYLWDFGDGTTSTQAFPTHTYTGIGSYVLCLTITDSMCSSSVCDTIAITVKASGTTLNVLPAGTALSLDENVNIQELTASPNPSNGNFVLDLTALNDAELNITLMNLAGQSVYSASETISAGANKLTVNQEGLSNGVYLLRVTETNSGAVKTIRIVKK